jgi:prepilin-type processing-associated H-X9-DG protein
MKPGRNNRIRRDSFPDGMCVQPFSLALTQRAKTQPRCRLGFSMLELLLVIAILVLLTTLMWAPRTGRRDQARLALCKNQLERVFIAMQIYATDSGSRFPVVADARTAGKALEVLVPRYTSDIGLFLCPGTRDRLKPDSALGEQKISYSYYMGGRLNDPGQPVLTDAQAPATNAGTSRLRFSTDGKPPGNNHGKLGGMVLFCDGHAESRKPGSSVTAVIGPSLTLLNP